MKLLVVRVGAMGDVLHALPAVAALRRQQPDWRIDWVVDPRWAPLLAAFDTVQQGRGPVVDRVHLADTRLWSRAPVSMATLRSVLQLRAKLRADRFDLAIDLQGTLRSAVIARMSRVPVRAGYSDPREPLAASFYTRRVERHGAHVVEQNAALLSDTSGIPLQPAAFDLPHEAWADNWAAELVRGQRVCVLAPGAGWGAKRWPVESFGALATELRAMGFSVMVNAPRKDDALAAKVVAASHGAAQTVVCNVTGLTALLRRTVLLVGGDSGPMHLAAALDIPLVALFGPTSPERNGPWGSGPKVVLRDPASATSYKRRGETDAGLARIRVAAVVEAVRQLV